jgi:formylglycine-generating enzyme required for sulfatase activity
VWQWTQDAFDAKPVDKVGDGGELVAGAASSRVNRGGSWFFDAGYCRTAIRSENSPDVRLNFLGFRLARVPVEVGGK